MDYNFVMNKLLDSTKDMINKALEIFDCINNGDISYHHINDDGNYVEDFAKDDDKKVISLFLSGLLNDDNLKRMMNGAGIYAEDFAEYFDIKLLDFKSLTDEKRNLIFNNCFSSLFCSIEIAIEVGNLLDKELFLKVFSPEFVMNMMADSDIVKSSIIGDYYLSNYGKSFIAHESYNQLDNFQGQTITNIMFPSKSFYNFNNQANNNRIDDKSILGKYGRNLTTNKYSINPAIGRDKEINQLILSLVTPCKSAILVGEAGVGKTAVVEGLAYKIQNNDIPNVLNNKKIIEINTSSLVAGCSYVGMFEDKVNSLINELKNRSDIILFIDEFHNVIGTGRSDGKNMDFANILKPYLARGEIKMIGATTSNEYQDYIMGDSAFKRRFEKVEIKEPEDSDLYFILDGVISIFIEQMKLGFNLDRELIISSLIDVTKKNNRNHDDSINNPDLAISILGRSFAHAIVNNSSEVLIQNVADSIRECTRLTESVRNREADYLLNAVKHERNKCKVIDINSYKRKLR